MAKNEWLNASVATILIARSKPRFVEPVQQKVMQSQKFESAFHPEMRPLVAQSSVVKHLLAASIAVLGTIAAEAAFFSVQAASLTNWNFDPAANQLEITVKDGTTPHYFLMAQPARIVVDLPDTAVGDVSAQKNYVGAVRQIRVSQFAPGLTRIVMEISPDVSLAPGQVKLQKVGNDAARSGSARWVLQPLITKALSANAVTAKPSKPLQPGRSGIALAKPVANPATAQPVLSAPTAESSGVTKRASAPQRSATASNIAPAPAISGSKPSATTNPTMADRLTVDGVDQPAATVPSIPSAPTAPAALAPALPSSPPAAQSGEQTETPLPPVVAPLVDPNVAVDTQGGVAIAVPTPTTLAATTLLSSRRASSQPSIAAPAKPVDSTPRGVVAPVQQSVAASVTRSTPNFSSTPVVKPIPATVASRSTSQPIATVQSAAVPNPSPLEMPTTLAAVASVPTPTVSVPPLNAPAPGLPPSPTPTQRSQSDSTMGTPRDSVPASANFKPRSTAAAQPTVSVPPLIRVGTPSLGLPLIAAPIVESAPPTSVFSPSATVTPPVAVPPLHQSPAPVTVQPGVAQTSYDANTVRRQPSSSSANLAPPMTDVPLAASPQASVTPGYDATTVRQAPTNPAPTSIVDFGQPLPATSRNIGQPLSSLPNATTGVRQTFKPAAPNVLLPAGTTLNLRYPGNASLTLRAENPQQEILVLLTELRDVSGNLLAPAGSTVTGQFETTTSGSQFVTQAIVVAGHTVPLTAQSEALDGARKVENNNLARNSGIGVLAGGVLGALGGSIGLGALGGAAAGAATTLLTAPKPAIIQPGQIVQVRLTQDLRSAE